MESFVSFILFFLLFYFLFKFIWRRYKLSILKYVSKKFQQNIHKRFQQEFHQKYTDQNEPFITSTKKNSRKTNKNHKVGEYVDFEEVE
ncbi:DUF4834 family protein [Psychroflexus planctonicus]|uniref:DUF4834 family protein n=1 Tax=Psychroflexus planctonicus TaxID=1526575 RepID=UPI00166BA105|nr:DUF4834 family protein [Psychroflexus planctonicus]